MSDPSLTGAEKNASSTPPGRAGVDAWVEAANDQLDRAVEEHLAAQAAARSVLTGPTERR
jgi:hypothetical protein